MVGLRLALVVFRIVGFNAIECQRTILDLIGSQMKKKGSMAKTLIPVHVDSFHPISLFIAVFLSIASGQSVKQPTLQISHFSGSMTDWGVQGDVKDAVTWIDSGDSSVLIVSEIQKGEINAKGYVSKVFGYHFIKQSGKWKMNFSIKEPNQSPNEIIHYQNGSIHIENVDGQGGAETIFFYSIAMDGGVRSHALPA